MDAMEAGNSGAHKMTTDWWRGGVIYQIYPRSFQDSNDDGIGDLKGIAMRLPYVASLGVDAIWLSPFFTSPMKDFGYDVSDYCDVDPMFGTLADFDAVLDTAHHLGLKVMIDLVLSHTSDQHLWFRDSKASKTADKADWYVWADARPDGTPPNNWLSVFGGPAWQWDAGRCQYYLHNFLTSQPDLNLHNPDVQQALLDVARFWMKRGVDGFRLDAVNYYFCDRALRDNPPMPVEERNDLQAPSVNPYNYQRHVHSKNQPENVDFLRRFRACLDEYGACAVGEVGDGERGPELIGEYTKGNDLLQMCYAFEFLAGDPATAERTAAIFERFDRVAADGWACWAFSNHDVERVRSRWHLPAEADRTYAMLLLSLRGSVCIYQGEELGFSEVDVPFEALQDPYGVEFWPEFKGRDGCRTPMAWETGSVHGGFTKVTPWLPVADEQKALAVDVQDKDANSELNFWRTALDLRRHHEAFAGGDQTAPQAVGDVLTFTRTAAGETVFCAFNLGAGEADVPLPEGVWTPIASDLGCAEIAKNAKKLHLKSWQWCLAEKNG